MDRGFWQTIVHGVAKSQTQLCKHTHTHTHTHAEFILFQKEIDMGGEYGTEPRGCLSCFP